MADRKRLEGRVALITGGGRGIGRAIALAYAAEGSRLALTARTASELEETAKLAAGRFGSDAITVVADVSSREEVEQAVALALGHYGAIDVLVNNAGNIGPVGRGLGQRPGRLGPHHSGASDGRVLWLPRGSPLNAGAGTGPHSQYVRCRRAQYFRLRCGQDRHRQPD